MARIEFSWQHPNPENLTYRLYEDGSLAVDDIGELHFSLLMADKPHAKYSYHVTAVNQFNQESPPSNRVEADFFPPSAPTGLSASFVG